MEINNSSNTNEIYFPLKKLHKIIILVRTDTLMNNSSQDLSVVVCVKCPVNLIIIMYGHYNTDLITSADTMR